MEGLIKAGLSVTFAARKPPAQPGFEWLPMPASRRILPWIKRRWSVIYFPWNSAAVENEDLFDLGIPAIISCRGSQINVAPHNPERRALREGLKRTFEKAARVHCVSEAIKKEAEIYGLDPAKAEVIRPAVDTEFFSPAIAKKTGGEFRIVSTGGLSWVKGFEYAVMAVKKLADMKIPVRYEIIGSGSDRQRILYTAHDLGVADRVFLRGRLEPAQVRETLRSSHVFLLSSLAEGISNAALEAMACGLPVVTADCGGMREAVTDGAEGLVVPAGSAGAMAEALKRIYEDGGRAAAMSAAARRRAETCFGLRGQVGSFVRLFSEAAHEK